jgi:hypothetical protein
VHCPVCRVEAPLELTGGHEVTVGTVAAAIERRPVIACPQAHGATPQEVVGAAMGAVEANVPRAVGRLLRSDACVACGTPLSMPVRRTTRAVTVEGDARRPVLTLRFDLPSTRCPACAVEQVPSRSQEDLVVAVPAVFTPRSSPPA